MYILRTQSERLLVDRASVFVSKLTALVEVSPKPTSKGKSGFNIAIKHPQMVIINFYF